jgi:hypothetical protein
VWSIALEPLPRFRALFSGDGAVARIPRGDRTGRRRFPAWVSSAWGLWHVRCCQSYMPGARTTRRRFEPNERLNWFITSEHKQTMKIIAIVISLACFSHGALADDQSTPTPTPVYLNRLARPGSLRRVEQIDRRRALQAESDSKAQARAQAKANRRSTAATQAQSRAAVRAREQAQRKVDAEARIEAANATPQANSDLMKRMGFSQQEIVAQKAREESVKPGAKETTDTKSQAGRQPEQSKPAVDSGVLGDHPAPSPAKP